MKKLIYVFIMAIFVPMILTANNDLIGQNALVEKAPAFTKAQFISAEQPAELFHKSPSLLKGLPPYYADGLVKNPLSTTGALVQCYAGTVGSNVNQFWFDPISNYMVILTSSNDGDFTTGSYAHNTFQITYSKDFGKTWSAKRFPTDTVTGKLTQFPSGGMINRTGTTDINKIDMIMTAITYKWQMNTSGGFGFSSVGNGITFSWQVDGVWNDEIDPYELLSPTNGSSWEYTFGAASVYENGDDVVITSGQRLSQANDNAQWGMYGQASVSFPSYSIITDIPDEWQANVFYKDAATGFSSTTNSDMFQATDNVGNVYVCVANQFSADNPSKARTFGVSMSGDMGASWSDFNVVPPTLIGSFLTAQGAEVSWSEDMVNYYSSLTGQSYATLLGEKISGVHNPYEKKAMVAISENNYSCFSVVLLYKKEGSKYAEYPIIAEYNWNGSAWTITKVADLEGSNYLTLSLNNDGQPVYRRSYFEDGVALTASKTADNANIILSWIDINQQIPLTEPIEVFAYDGDTQTYVSAGMIDTLSSSDIFIGSRPATTKAWSTFQVTNDRHFNKGLQLPATVSSLNHVTLLGCQGLFSGNEENPDPYRNLDTILNEVRTDRWMGYYVLDINFSEKDKYHDIKISVNDDATAFTLSTPYPNPASDVAEVTFSVETAAYTTIKLYDAIGNEIQTIQDGFVSAGNHGLTVNTSALSSGAYYIVLSNGSASTTQMLNVIR